MSRLGRYAAAAALAVLAALWLSPAAPAAGRRFEPLNQYVVGKVDPDELARAGFDLNEASSAAPTASSRSSRPRRRRRGCASRARRSGAVRRGRAMSRAAFAADEPDARLRRLPAVEPEARSVPRHVRHAAQAAEGLSTSDLARANPDVVKRKVDRPLACSASDRRLQGHADARDRATARARRCSSTPRSTRASGSPPRSQRRLFTYVVTHKNDRESQNISGCCAPARAVVRPDRQPRRLRLHLHVGGARACGARTCATSTATARSRNVDGVDTNRNWPRSGTTTSRARPTTPTSETYHGSGAGSEPEVQAHPRAERRIKPKFLIDYHSFAQLILYPEGWQVETPSTDTPLMAALAGRRRQPGRARASTPTSRPSSTRPTATSPTTPTHAFGDAGLHGRARRRDRRRRRRHRRQRPGRVHAGRLRLPGLRGRHPGRVREERRVRARPRPLGQEARPAASRISATRRRTSCRRRSRRLLRLAADRRGQREAPLGAVRVRWQVNDGRMRSARHLGVQGRRALRRAGRRTTTACAARSPARARATGSGLVHRQGRRAVGRRSRTRRSRSPPTRCCS